MKVDNPSTLESATTDKHLVGKFLEPKYTYFNTLTATTIFRKLAKNRQFDFFALVSTR